MAHRRGGLVRLVDEVAAPYGQLGPRAVPLRPYFPQGKAFIERMNRFLEASFLPLRWFASLPTWRGRPLVAARFAGRRLTVPWTEW